MAETIREGGCLCGGIRYRATGEPQHVELCHCTMCRRATGSPVVAWATFQRSRFEWLTEPLALYDSSPKAQRAFCPKCGSALLYISRQHTKWLDVTVGSFDDPDSLVPKNHIYSSTRVGWVDVQKDLPAYPEGRPKPG